jgi:gamma-glutamyl-gamma-aminobutyrate hydrolase PuuD
MNSILYSAYYKETDPFGIFKETIPFMDLDVMPNTADSVDGVLVLWGGGDISPTIYGQKPIRYTGATEKLSERDKFEVACAKKAMSIGMPIIGVCRGAQLMCALNGGSLIQHVDGHAGGTHLIRTFDGKLLATNSIHHQMMNLVGTEHKLLGWAEHRQSNRYIVEDNEHIELDIEPELVWFPKTKTLAIQGHPEYLYPSHELVEYCTGLIKRILNGEQL